MAMGFIVTSQTAYAKDLYSTSIILVEQVGPDLYDVKGVRQVEGEHDTRYSAVKKRSRSASGFVICLVSSLA